MAGFANNNATVNQRAGQVALTLRNALREARDWKEFMDGFTVADLQQSPFNFTPTEATVLKDAATDQYNLFLTATGARTQPAASDFLFNVKKLIGPL